MIEPIKLHVDLSEQTIASLTEYQQKFLNMVADPTEELDDRSKAVVKILSENNFDGYVNSVTDLFSVLTGQNLAPHVKSLEFKTIMSNAVQSKCFITVKDEDSKYFGQTFLAAQIDSDYDIKAYMVDKGVTDYICYTKTRFATIEETIAFAVESYPDLSSIYDDMEIVSSSIDTNVDDIRKAILDVIPRLNIKMNVIDKADMTDVEKCIESRSFGCQHNVVIKLVEAFTGEKIRNFASPAIPNGAFVVSTGNTNSHNYPQDVALLAYGSNSSISTKALHPTMLKNGNNLSYIESKLVNATSEQIEAAVNDASDSLLQEMVIVLNKCIVTKNETEKTES